MKYFILPENIDTSDKTSWIKDDILTLGGYFYDFLKSSDGYLIGIRYYINNESGFKEESVFNRFINDGRFFFSHENGYIDILLDINYKHDFDKKIFNIDIVQEFGGDYVLRNKEKIGICFEI
jgi:hypothetical protein